MSRTAFIASRGGWPLSGLYATSLADDHGSPSSPRHLDHAIDLAALALHPTLDVLYGACGVGRFGTIAGWQLRRGPAAERLFRVPSGGAEPCHLAVDPAGAVLIALNYSSGTLALWRLDERGGLSDSRCLVDLIGTGSGVDADRQDAPHPHQAAFAGPFLYVSDLGADLIHRFRVRADQPLSGYLEPAGLLAVPPGSGPRHLVLLDGGQRIAVSCELAETVVVRSTEPADDSWTVVPSSWRDRQSRSRFHRNHVGDLTITPDGSHLIVANRGYDTLGVIRLSGPPELVAEVEATVRWPQHLAWDGYRLLVAGWDSSAVRALPWCGPAFGSSIGAIDVPNPAWLVVTDRADQVA